MRMNNRRRDLSAPQVAKQPKNVGRKGQNATPRQRDESDSNRLGTAEKALTLFRLAPEFVDSVDEVERHIHAVSLQRGGLSRAIAQEAVAENGDIRRGS